MWVYVKSHWKDLGRMRSFTDVLLLLLSHGSFSLWLSHPNTQRRGGYVLVIKQGQSLPSQTHTHTQPEGKGAGLAWYLIVTAVSHWQCELIYQPCTWTIWTYAHFTKPYEQIHMLTNRQEVCIICVVKLKSVHFNMKEKLKDWGHTVGACGLWTAFHVVL